LDYLWDKKLENIEQVRIREACKKIEKDFLENRKKRRTGESYEEHPYEVAHILLDLIDREDIDTDTIIACLFHDHIEDIHADTHETLKNNYNSYIAFVVHLLSKEDIEE